MNSYTQRFTSMIKVILIHYSLQFRWERRASAAVLQDHHGVV